MKKLLMAMLLMVLVPLIGYSQPGKPAKAARADTVIATHVLMEGSSRAQKMSDTLTFDFTRTQFNTEILNYVAWTDTTSLLAYVKSLIAAGVSFDSAAHLAYIKYLDGLKAPIASPTFTGYVGIGASAINPLGIYSANTNPFTITNTAINTNVSTVPQAADTTAVTVIYIANKPYFVVTDGSGLKDTLADLSDGRQQVSDSLSAVSAGTRALATPNIGAATGASLALGGATLGTNKLAVTGDINISSGIYRIGSVALMQYSGGVAYLGTSEAYDLSLAAGSLTRMRINNSTGFIGLGTTTPYHQQSIATTDSAGWILFKRNINTVYNSLLQERDTAAIFAQWNASTLRWDFIRTSSTGVPDTLAGLSEVIRDTNNVALNAWKNNNSLGVGTLTAGEELYAASVDSLASHRKEWNVKLPPFNAVGDNATDNAAAFNSAFDSLRAHQGSELVIPPGNYVVESTINATRLLRNKISAPGRGSWIILETTGTPGIDFTGSGYLSISDIAFQSAEGAAAPNVMALFARDSATSGAYIGETKLIDCAFYGPETGTTLKACVYNYGDEVAEFRGTRISIRSDSCVGYYVTSVNDLNVTSAFETIMTGSGVTASVYNFYGGVINETSTNHTAIPLYIHNAQAVNIHGTWFYAAGHNNQFIYVKSDSTNNYTQALNINSVNFEGSAKYVVYAEGAASFRLGQMVGCMGNVDSAAVGVFGIYPNTFQCGLMEGNQITGVYMIKTDGAINSGYIDAHGLKVFATEGAHGAIIRGLSALTDVISDPGSTRSSLLMTNDYENSVSAMSYGGSITDTRIRTLAESGLIDSVATSDTLYLGFRNVAATVDTFYVHSVGTINLQILIEECDSLNQTAGMDTLMAATAVTNAKVTLVPTDGAWGAGKLLRFVFPAVTTEPKHFAIIGVGHE